jgi:hypothetical protein
VLTDGTTSYLYDDAGTPSKRSTLPASPCTTDMTSTDPPACSPTPPAPSPQPSPTDPYGNLTAHTGTADTPLRWNRQYQDADTGLYYLGARYGDRPVLLDVRT